ncbi:MAG: lysylphosphatidylglycerol synthase transmembrane domain-containing protein [Gemmatimonadaceae bacterium]
MSNKHHAARILRYLVTGLIVGGLVVFARKVDWHAAWTAMRTAAIGPLVAAALLNLLSLALKGVRWWVFLRAVGAPSLSLALRATAAGAGLNNVLVANGGEAARIVFVARATHIPSATILATLAVERLFDFVGYVALLTFAAFALPIPASIARWRPVAVILVVCMSATLIYLVRRPGPALVEAADLALGPVAPRSFGARARAYGGHFIDAVSTISSAPRFGAAIALSVVAWISQVATFALTAQAARFALPLAGSVAAVLSTNLSLLVRATPGNVGVFQAVYAMTAVGFGLDKDPAVAVAFLLQTLQILPVTLLGIALAPEFVFSRRRAPHAAAQDQASPAMDASRGVERRLS